MPPCSQTGVAGRIGARSVPPPFGRTSSQYATGSQRVPLTGSPVPGTSGEKRAVAVAVFPGASVTSTAVSAPGCAGNGCVGSFVPRRSRSVMPGMPVTVQAAADLFSRRSA